MKIKILMVFALLTSSSLSQGKELLLKTLVGHTEEIHYVSFSPDGQTLASTDRNTIKFWNLNTEEVNNTIIRDNYISSFTFSPDGQILASICFDTIKLWNVNNGELVKTLSGSADGFFSISFSPDGQTLAAPGESGHKINLWNVYSGEIQKTLWNGGIYFIWSISFSADGQGLASISMNSAIDLWNVSTGKINKTLLEKEESGYSVSFSPDGQTLASASGNTIKLWNVSSGEIIKKLSGYKKSVYSVIFSPDGQTLVSLGDNSIKFWDLSNGELVKTLSGYSDLIQSVSFSPDGQILAVTNGKTIELWDVSEFNLDIRRDITNTSIKNKDAIAVVIGNKEYNKKEIPTVEYAINDASLVKEYLIKSLGYSPDNILYYENATQSDLYSLFGSKDNYKGKLYNYVKEGKSDVFIYYSGHGAPDLESRQGYFVPIDCDPALVALNGYSLNTFYQNLSNIKYKSLTVVIDACFSGLSEKGSLLKNISPIYISVENPIISNEKTTVFTSTGGDQVSSWYPEKKHSLFTYYFLKGLKGEANLDNNDVLNVGELKNYLIDNVPYMSRRLNNREQTPQIIGEDKTTIVKY